MLSHIHRLVVNKNYPDYEILSLSNTNNSRDNDKHFISTKVAYQNTLLSLHFQRQPDFLEKNCFSIMVH